MMKEFVCFFCGHHYSVYETDHYPRPGEVLHPSPRLAAMLKAAHNSARVLRLVFCRDPAHHTPDCECATL